MSASVFGELSLSVAGRWTAAEGIGTAALNERTGRGERCPEDQAALLMSFLVSGAK
jgi:uncharacterized protein YraI